MKSVRFASMIVIGLVLAIAVALSCFSAYTDVDAFTGRVRYSIRCGTFVLSQRENTDFRFYSNRLPETPNAQWHPAVSSSLIFNTRSPNYQFAKLWICLDSLIRLSDELGMPDSEKMAMWDMLIKHAVADGFRIDYDGDRTVRIMSSEDSVVRTWAADK